MIQPGTVHDTLRRHQLVDGYPLVMDLERSHGSYIHDAVSGEDFLDFFTCFASWPIGFDHPATRDAAYREEILIAGLNKPANSDLYTTHMASFVDAFGTHVTPPEFPHHFWVSGGALAVENALKVAFDWKARKVGVDSCEDGNSLVILHFRQAFHGRSGYTMSLTNTDPNKVALFPKFEWPRVHNPAIEFGANGEVVNDIEASEARACKEIEGAFECYKGRIAGIIIEPLQGEGGDNHFRPEFLQKLRQYADEHEALLIYDEVQTGFYGSGTPWLWQQKGAAPDVVAFGKKTQVCGVYAGKRVDEVADNVFVKSSRINSTWGGNLVDMVRCRKFIEIVTSEGLAENARERGDEMVAGLRALQAERGVISNVRGAGTLIAFTMENPGVRDDFVSALRGKHLLALPTGTHSVRFRMPLVVTAEDVSVALERVAQCLPAGVQA